MTNVGFATLDVIPSFKGFQGHLERGTTPGLLAAGRTGGTKFGDVAGRSAGERFGAVFRTAAKVGIFGTLAVAAGAIKVGADAIGEAREAQKVTRLTHAAIKSTGKAAKVSAKDVQRLSTNVAKMAGVNDELVQGGANVILTFKNIRNEQGKGNKIFDKATKAALDLSVGLDKDLTSSALHVGKALNDPVAGMANLSRAGVQFSADQKETIKTLVASGDTLGAQKIILKELSDEFGGAAKSQASSGDRLKAAFDNVKESIGKSLLPIMQDFTRFLLRKGIPAAQDFADWFNEEGVPAIGDFIDKAKPVAQKWLPKIGDGFKTAGGFAKDAAGFAGDMIGAFDKMPGWVKKVLIGGVAGGLTAKKLGLGKIVFGDNGLFSKGGSPARPLYVWTVNGGVGTGTGTGGKVGGAVSTGVKVLGTASLIGGIAAGISLGVGKVIGKETRESLAANGGQGVGLNADSKFFDLSDENAEKRRLERQKEFVARLGQEWLSTKNKANDYNLFIRHGLPSEISTNYTVTGIDVTQKKLRDTLALVLQVRDAINENKLDAAGGSGPAGSGFDPSNGTRPHGRPPSPRGVNVNIYGDVRPNDSREFFSELERRSTAARLDGWRK